MKLGSIFFKAVTTATKLGTSKLGRTEVSGWEPVLRVIKRPTVRQRAHPGITEPQVTSHLRVSYKNHIKIKTRETTEAKATYNEAVGQDFYLLDNPFNLTHPPLGHTGISGGIQNAEPDWTNNLLQFSHDRLRIRIPGNTNPKPRSQNIVRQVQEEYGPFSSIKMVEKDPEINKGLPNIPPQESINSAILPDLSNDCVVSCITMLGELNGSKINQSVLRRILTRDGQRPISKAFQKMPINKAFNETGITYRMKPKEIDFALEALGFKSTKIGLFGGNTDPILNELKTGKVAMVNKNQHMVIVMWHNGRVLEMHPLRGYWAETDVSKFSDETSFNFLERPKPNMQVKLKP